MTPTARASCSPWGPPVAEDSLREAMAWGADHGGARHRRRLRRVGHAGHGQGARRGARREGPFDLILVGRNSIDADTGQVGPEVAELLGLPFAGGSRSSR